MFKLSICILGVGLTSCSTSSAPAAASASQAITINADALYNSYASIDKAKLAAMVATTGELPLSEFFAYQMPGAVPIDAASLARLSSEMPHVRDLWTALNIDPMTISRSDVEAGLRALSGETPLALNLGDLSLTSFTDQVGQIQWHKLDTGKDGTDCTPFHNSVDFQAAFNNLTGVKAYSSAYLVSQLNDNDNQGPSKRLKRNTVIKFYAGKVEGPVAAARGQSGWWYMSNCFDYQVAPPKVSTVGRTKNNPGPSSPDSAGSSSTGKAGSSFNPMAWSSSDPYSF